MKHAVLSFAVVGLLVGCGGQEQKPEAKASTPSPAPAIAEQPKAEPAAAPAATAKTEAPRAAQPAVPPAVSKSPLVSSVTPAPIAPTNRMPTVLDVFLRVPPAIGLKPGSEASKVIEEAQELFRQGQTNAAVVVLTNAVHDPACETGGNEINRKLVALLLTCGRVGDAQAVCLEYAASGKPGFFGISLVTRYLMDEKGDPEAAVAWTERLRKLPLSEPAVDQNLKDNLTALSAAGRLDEIVERVPEIMARSNRVQSTGIMGEVAYRMITRSKFDQADRFLDAIEVNDGGKHAYTNMVAGLRKTLDRERAKAASPPPGK